MKNAKEIVLQRCAKDLIFFGKVITPKVFYLPTPDFHYEVCNLMMDRSIKQLSIQAPRGFAKSSLSTRFILHHILFDKGDKVVVIQSKTRSEAINRLTEIKNILEYSEAFRDLFGYAGKFADGTTMWREDKIKCMLGDFSFTIKAIGTGMPARGMLESSENLEIWRITLYFLDDPDDEDNTLTKEQMDKNYDKFAGSKEGMDKRNGRVLAIGTPIRQGCLIDRITDIEGWESRVYKAYYEEDGIRKMLWEEMRDYEWLMDKKREFEAQGNRRKFYSEFMCEIMGEDDQLFKGWKYWDGDFDLRQGNPCLIIKRKNKIDLPEPEVVPINVFMGIDPASSTKQSADYSVTFLIGYDADENIYTLPYYRQRVNPVTHADQIIETIKKFKPTRGHVETVGYQEMLRQYLRKKLFEENIYLPGLETKFNPRSEKSARLEVMQPFFATGKVYIKEGQEELEEELRMYPRGKHDDLPDGLYYATRKLFPPDHTTETDIDPLRYFPMGNLQTTAWSN